MTKQMRIAVALLVALLLGGLWLARMEDSNQRWTGFVEGEERVIRAEVAGRVIKTLHQGGDLLGPGEIVAVLDTADIDARLEAQRSQLAVADAEILGQEEQVKLTEGLWRTGTEARRAELRRAEAAAAHAEGNLIREIDLERSGASTRQHLDDAGNARDQAQSALDQARDMVSQAEEEKRQIPLAHRQLEAKQRRRGAAAAQLRELDIARGKAKIRAPAVGTLLQTRFLREGELAQPGSAMVAVIDPKENYVRVYLPAEEMSRLTIGVAVVFRPDGAPDLEIAGEIAFIADQASFTPEKIESRSDRLGQVFLAKIRILDAPERLLPGTEGDVWPKAPAYSVAQEAGR